MQQQPTLNICRAQGSPGEHHHPRGCVCESSCFLDHAPQRPFCTTCIYILYPGRLCLQSEAENSNMKEGLFSHPSRARNFPEVLWLSFSKPALQPASNPQPGRSQWAGSQQGPRSHFSSLTSIASDPPVDTLLFTDLLISIKYLDIFKSSPFTSYKTCRVQTTTGC